MSFPQAGRRRRLAIALLACVVPWSGCFAPPALGPIEVRQWVVHAQDPWNVTFVFTVANVGEHEARFIESHLRPEQFEATPGGGVQFGPGGFVRREEFPAVAQERPALFNDSEALGPGESRRFTIVGTYPPGGTDGPDRTYAAHLILEYVSDGVRWRTNHISPCVRADGTEGPGYECGERSEDRRPME